MKKCEECKIWISTPANNCPLCGTQLLGENMVEVHVYPKIIKSTCKPDAKIPFMHWVSQVATTMLSFLFMDKI